MLEDHMYYIDVHLYDTSLLTLFITIYLLHRFYNCGITNNEQLESKLRSDMLNDHIHQHNLPRLHQVTIHGFRSILGMADFRQGRS
jgi:hypothetical protein